MEVLLGEIEAPARRLGRVLAHLTPRAALPWLHRSEAAGPRAAAPARAAARESRLPAFEGQILPLLDAAYSFARFLARDADAAHDIVQEAFLRAYRAYAGFHGGDPRAWLFSIVRNCHRDWQSGRSRARRFEADAPGPDAGEADGHPEPAAEEDGPEAALIRKSEAARVRAVLQGLPEGLREILVLRELEDLSYREIAGILGVPIGTVMSRLSRARALFGTVWRDADEGGGR